MPKCMIFYQSIIGLPEIQTASCLASEESWCEGASRGRRPVNVMEAMSCLWCVAPIKAQALGLYPTELTSQVILRKSLTLSVLSYLVYKLGDNVGITS